MDQGRVGISLEIGVGEIGDLGLDQTSVMMPGVWRWRFGSSIRSIPAAGRLLLPSVASGTPVSIIGSFVSGTERWLCSPPG